MKIDKTAAAIVLVGSIVLGVLTVFVVDTFYTPDSATEQKVESVEPAKPKEPEEITVYATAKIYEVCSDYAKKLVLSEDTQTIFSEGTKANVCVLEAIGDRNALVAHMRKTTKVVGKVYSTPWNGYTVYWAFEDGEIGIRVDSNGQTVTETVGSEEGLSA